MSVPFPLSYLHLNLKDLTLSFYILLTKFYKIIGKYSAKNLVADQNGIWKIQVIFCTSYVSVLFIMLFSNYAAGCTVNSIRLVMHDTRRISYSFVTIHVVSVE